MPEAEDKGCEGWTHETLLTYVRAIIKEMDLRYDQRFRAQETAIDKAEKAQETRNQTLNELRGIVTDQQGSFSRTAVVNLQVEALAARIASVELDMRGTKERGMGVHVVISYLVGVAGAVAALIAFWSRIH